MFVRCAQSLGVRFDTRSSGMEVVTTHGDAPSETGSSRASVSLARKRAGEYTGSTSVRHNRCSSTSRRINSTSAVASDVVIRELSLGYLRARTTILAPDPESVPETRSPEPGDDYLISLATAPRAVIVSATASQPEPQHLFDLDHRYLPERHGASSPAALEAQPNVTSAGRGGPSGWSHNWQRRWSHVTGKTTRSVVPCHWQTTSEPSRRLPS